MPAGEMNNNIDGMFYINNDSTKRYVLTDSSSTIAYEYYYINK